MKRGLLICAVALFALGGSAQAATLSKSKARSVAAKATSKSAAKQGWASRLGACKRKSKARVICLGRVIGETRNCRVRVVVWKAKRKTRSRVRRYKCAATSPALLGTVRLRAKLSSAPRRDVSDPFKATYDYSAGATEQRGAVEQETSPPAGVIALYVDGLLNCAQNTADRGATAECSVKHEELGPHRVTTIYTSGNESATDTIDYNLDPIPAKISASVEFESEGVGVSTGKGLRIGMLQITATSDPEQIGAPYLECRFFQEPDCLPLPPFDIGPTPRPEPTYSVPVYAECPQPEPLPEGTVVPCTEVKVDPIPVGSSSAEIIWRDAQQFIDGEVYFRLLHKVGPQSGYVGTETTVPVQFEPFRLAPAT